MGREIGYALNKEYWAKGLMTEGVSKLINYCFQNEKYDFLSAQYFEHNFRSKRVLEKLGFKYIKDLNSKTRMGLTGKSKFLLLLKENFEKLETK